MFYGCVKLILSFGAKRRYDICSISNCIILVQNISNKIVLGKNWSLKLNITAIRRSGNCSKRDLLSKSAEAS